MGATKPLTVRAWSGTDQASRVEHEYVAAARGRQELELLARSLRLPDPSSCSHPLDPDGAAQAALRPGVVFCRRLAHRGEDHWVPVGSPGVPAQRRS